MTTLQCKPNSKQVYSLIGNLFYTDRKGGGAQNKVKYIPSWNELPHRLGSVDIHKFTCRHSLFDTRTSLERERLSYKSPPLSCNSFQLWTLQLVTSEQSLKDLATRRVPCALTKGRRQQLYSRSIPLPVVWLG